MKKIYLLTHNKLIELDKNTGEEICDIKILGFFSSKDKCDEAIKNYLCLPGFKDYPNRFFIETIEADINDFNNVEGEFAKFVYYLSHEWYDGEFDYVNHLGYYSSMEKAEEAKEKYKMQEEFKDDLNGFGIDEYEIDVQEWLEGFFTWK